MTRWTEFKTWSPERIIFHDFPSLKYWCKDIDQQVAVEDLVYNVGYSSPQSLPMAVSATLIGKWQTDFVIDHNAQGKWWLYYSLVISRFMKGHISLKLHKRQMALTRLWKQWRKSLVPLCVCKQYDCSCLCTCVVTDAFGRAHRRREEGNRHRLSRWVRVLLCISRWPLKVALCHNTLVPMTPAAVKCHRPLLSASQPARLSRQPSLPHLQGKPLLY